MPIVERGAENTGDAKKAGGGRFKRFALPPESLRREAQEASGDTIMDLLAERMFRLSSAPWSAEDKVIIKQKLGIVVPIVALYDAFRDDQSPENEKAFRAAIEALVKGERETLETVLLAGITALLMIGTK